MDGPADSLSWGTREPILNGMNLNSKYFDSIRVAATKPRAKRLAQEQKPRRQKCAWPGCKERATHKAPIGRHKDGAYRWYCLDHVREYNRGYNYFDGMSDDEVAAFQAESVTGHRPTWELGERSWAHGTEGKNGSSNGFEDPYEILEGMKAGAGAHAEDQRPRRRAPRNAERRALSVLGADIDSSPEDIKARYKQLVKRHHPDANGGDRASEDRLREVIQAYDYLKTSGFC